MTDPTIAYASTKDGLDPLDAEQLTEQGRAWAAEHVPPRYADATATNPVVRSWVVDLVDRAVTERRVGLPTIRTGGSLLLVGPVGTGKTWEAYGALRALSAGVVVCRWRALTERRLFGRLRPRPDVNAEQEYDTLATCPVLLLDDLGSEVRSTWNESVLLGLINDRNEHLRPTIITSNVKASEFGTTFGDRTTSRLDEMCTRVAFTGPDRRRSLR